jgi:putative aminopeptidase FrvX
LILYDTDFLHERRSTILLHYFGKEEGVGEVRTVSARTEGLTQLLAELDPIPGVSGAEEEVAEFVKGELNGCYDRFRKDALGNHFFTKKGANPQLDLMLSAHMDEVGFVIHHVDEKGFAYFTPVGLHDDRTLANQVLTVYTERGPVRGLTGGKPAHIVSKEEAQKAPPISEVYLDLGTASREQTEALGVRVGDYVTFERPGQLLNDGRLFTGKAVDDRAGVAVLIEVMRRLADVEVEANVHAVATVQEEVGIRGAGPAAFRIKPDVALAIDVTLAGGTPGIEDRQLPVKLGEGPAIKFFDWAPGLGMIGNNVPKRLTSKLVAVAEERGIPYQREVLFNGATDAWSMSLSGEGVATGTISLPSRYIHSAIGCVCPEDLAGAVDLIAAFAGEFKEPL